MFTLAWLYRMKARGVRLPRALWELAWVLALVEAFAFGWIFAEALL